MLKTAMRPCGSLPVYLTPAEDADYLPDSTFDGDVVGWTITDPPLTRWV